MKRRAKKLEKLATRLLMAAERAGLEPEEYAKTGRAPKPQVDAFLELQQEFEEDLEANKAADEKRKTAT